MPESFLGDGLIYEGAFPLAWKAGTLTTGLELSRLNADNHQLLGAEASLDEVRIHEALKDESPALVHELQRLEYKLNIILRLTAQLAVQNAALPSPQAVRFSARGLEWESAEAPAVQTTGLARLYINPALPQPLMLPAIVSGERVGGSMRVAQLCFMGLSEVVLELLQKLIFRHHRRLVAGSRQASK